MLLLLASILLNAYLTLCFKAIEKLKVNTFQAIVFNYIFCVITGSLFNRNFPVNKANMQQPWFLWAVGLGLFFISTFRLAGFTTQKAGVSVTSVAWKLSLVIPFMFSVFLYNEPLTAFKATGIVLALLAVYLTIKKKNNEATAGNSMLAWLLPVIFFISTGLLDTLIKYTEQRFVDGNNSNDFLITAFTGAAAAGILLLMVLLVTGAQILQPRAILAGLAIGIPNYFSIWTLVKVLKLYAGNSSAIIPINNMGVVLVSAVAAWLLFREKLSPVNWAGITLSIIAIALVAFG